MAEAARFPMNPSLRRCSACWDSNPLQEVRIPTWRVNFLAARLEGCPTRAPPNRSGTLEPDTARSEHRRTEAAPSSRIPLDPSYDIPSQPPQPPVPLRTQPPSGDRIGALTSAPCRSAQFANFREGCRGGNPREPWSAHTRQHFLTLLIFGVLLSGASSATRSIGVLRTAGPPFQFFDLGRLTCLHMSV